MALRIAGSEAIGAMSTSVSATVATGRLRCHSRLRLFGAWTVVPASDRERPHLLTWIRSGGKRISPHHHAAVMWLRAEPGPTRSRAAASLRSGESVRNPTA